MNGVISGPKPPNINKIMSINGAILSKFRYCALYLFGIKNASIREPSRGGKGSKLKNARLRFINMKSCDALHNIEKKSMFCESEVAKKAMNFKERPPMNAKNKLEIGPASATVNIALLGNLKFLGSTTTGFAQPKFVKKSIMAPIGSRCLIGLRVSLPIRLGVGSPRKSAILA